MALPWKQKMSDPWTHSFSVTDTQLHKGQFTIYRITSIIFPEAIPGALSCITIWKRYSDVMDLHQRLSKRLKQERLKAIKLPPLHKGRAQFFHRFDAQVIEVRRQGILDLLEFIGSQPTLYSCDVFAKFLQGGYTPLSSPRAHQRQDIATTMKTSQVGVDTDKLQSDSEDRSSTSMAEDRVSIVTTTSSQAEVDALTATSVLHPRFSSDYLVEASERFNEAVQLEVNDRYAEALAVYKDGIEVLMTGIRSDSDAARFRMAKKKVEKYLSRSENIYEHFLKPSGTDRHDPTSKPQSIRNSAGYELPLNQLAKYKVIRVLNENVMSVQEVTTRRFFIIKSIDRTSDWNKGLGGEGSREGDLTYMVSLVAYFVTEFVIFLLLQPASGGKIMDYVAEYENQPKEEEETIAPAYETMSPDLEIEELLKSSQKLLNSVQKTLDASKGEEVTEKSHKSSSSVLNTNQKIPEACVRQWAKELIVAINCLHERNIILGHLGADNLLLGKSGQLLLTYYHYRNYSKAIPKCRYSEEAFLAVGAVDRAVGPELDWYYVGIVLYELLLGCRFTDFHPGGVWYYFDLQYPEDVQLSGVALKLLRGLLIEDPKLRFGFADICGHSFFNEAAAD